MPTAFTEPTNFTEYRRKRWTRSECQVLVDRGVVDGQRLELIGGDIIEKERKKPPYWIAAHQMWVWLSGVFGMRFIGMHSPIEVCREDNPTNEPEPDLIVLSRDASQFIDGNPQPQDLQLVVEVSDAYVGFDLTTKAALYARACIIEYWVLDVRDRRMIVHRDPQSGRYTSVTVYSNEETVSPLKAPNAKLRIAGVLVQS